MNVSSLNRLSPLASTSSPKTGEKPASAEPLDCVSLSEPQRETSFLQKAARALVFGSVAVSSLAGAAQAQQAQVKVQDAPRPRGLQFDMSREQVDQVTSNSVTAEQIGEGQPHFTAWDVDPSQSSKWYHNPETLEVVNGYGGQTRPDGDRFRMCSRFNTQGECTGVLMNQVSYSILSCIYYKQEDGQFYRVTQRSYQHQQTHAMQRNVCGGHELRHDGSQFASYAPYQLNREGDQLFLNPANIIKVERVEAPTGR